LLDEFGISICSGCRKFWHPRIIKTWSRSDISFPIYSSIPYSPIAGRVLLAAKENSLELADNLLESALLHSLHGARVQSQCDFLIPIPSRNSVARKRGRQFVSVLSRKISESEGLPTKDRAENLEGALVSLRFISGRAILVDDLVTTGATLREAARALRAVGIVVSAAVTACVAEPLR
jgi:predicted amidophosphoribosyltransferase